MFQYSPVLCCKFVSATISCAVKLFYMHNVVRQIYMIFVMYMDKFIVELFASSFVPASRMTTRCRYMRCIFREGGSRMSFLNRAVHKVSSDRRWQCSHSYNTPQSLITTFFEVLPLCEPTSSILSTTFSPDVTLPNTTCFPSSQAVFAVQRKN